ncbi:Sm ribonucleo [Sulfolobus sp. A20]|uniref:Lsm family RNA-binding protein n=1 Tax=Sulfolobaceae TaxID=118883 RepID=UPI000846229B|nr:MULTISPECIES: Lsm family RNA-binding protein [unclassified Sulfolobus]TRM73719.1 Sm ribonucleo [Sulfolobus sp. E5]TRM76558.1 Sm ribonucleo [Sulfolobus sp. B5]TRM77774.1 Sm ribonucleo [Sulfolobus sp. A20-N-F8]TRM81435.1 Sm ribonucleo [Sulfolobus sp. D5]TRM83915.1 Sm ribonucleo [Sulfolobus sp. A20-N-F6]TRM88712.1 Sm ribonucleo [Sulfolobus sp. C3]TRM94759.1 Sm ribonucleo [Sulfolobus sp. A20-N-G8]TRN00080.1 Sm ribonucleo [Sulfolobus sp. F1]TRN03102.1 Sm ribonucleo [Sulfolobus sp. E1]
MSSGRRVVNELNSLLDKTIIVKTTNNKTYIGQLSAFETSPFIISLTNAKDESNNIVYKLIINGNLISEIIVKSPPLFEPREFAEIVEKSLNLRPGDIKVYEETGVVTILDKIKVTQNGVEGSGPMAQRIYDIYNDYINKKKKELGL